MTTSQSSIAYNICNIIEMNNPGLTSSQQGSKPFKIFGHPKVVTVGMDVSQNTQGRNVQPFSSNKRIQQVVQKPIPSPFNGYLSNAGENNLAYSQVSDFNSEHTRKIVRQQLSKLGAGEAAKLKNDLQIMKLQVKSIKQNLTKNTGSATKIKDQFQQLKTQVIKQFDKVLQEYHQTTAANLRQVIKRFDQNIKGFCKSSFLPINFVNDAQKQFLQLEDKISALQKSGGKKQGQPSHKPIVVSEELDLRLKRVQRQNQMTKKTITQLQNFTNQQNQQIILLKSKQDEDVQILRQKIEETKKSMSDYQKQIKSANLSISQIKKNHEETTKRLDILQLEKNKSPQRWISRNDSNNSTSQVKQFLDSNRNMVVSGILEHRSSGNSNRQQFQGGNYNKNLFKSPQKDSPTLKQQQPRPGSLDHIKQEPQTRCKYKLSSENFLLDEDGNFILNSEEKPVQLTEQQVSNIKSSGIITFLE